MLSLTQVTLRRAGKLLFENATLQAHAGQRVGVVGANGCGKTSLFALLRGELEADSGSVQRDADAVIASVAQESPGGDRSAIDFVLDGDRELRRVQAAIALAGNGDGQELQTLYEQLGEIGGFDATARAARLLHGLGFSSDDGSRPVGEFSGGWKGRLSLARALMCRSDILLLDEPTNHLDLPAILWLEQWLKRYPGLLLLVSHDRDFLNAVCMRIVHIENNEFRVYTGNYDDFEKVRRERLAREQAMYRRQQNEIRHIQSYIDRFRYKASKARQAQSRLKALERMPEIAAAHVDSPFHFSFSEPERLPVHLSRLEAVSVGYGEPLLQDIDLQISAGDRIGLLGANGAGKSTLIKALADGSTLLAGKRSVSRDTRIGYFAQHQVDALDDRRSPMDHLRDILPQARESELRNHLGAFGFTGERVFEPVAPLSGGEKARLALALIVHRRPNLLLLDEPTNHLDLEMRQALSQALTGFGGALLLTSHDRHLLRSVCDGLLLVDTGELRRFDHALDEYPAWLSRKAGTARETGTSATPASKRMQRQRDARRRQALKPLSDRVRSIERKLDDLQSELGRLEARLADASLYADAAHKDELLALHRGQARIKGELQDLESDWLNAIEALEQAGATHHSA